MSSSAPFPFCEHFLLVAVLFSLVVVVVLLLLPFLRRLLLPRFLAAARGTAYGQGEPLEGIVLLECGATPDLTTGSQKRYAAYKCAATRKVLARSAF